MKIVLLFAVLTISVCGVAQPKWQQKADTKIDVQLDDKNHCLYAYEEIKYLNNSPDTLKFIYIHLWPNAYKNDRTPYARQQDLIGNTKFYYSKSTEKGYIDSLHFVIDGKSAEYYCTEEAPDVARLDLPHLLLPHQQITITTPFRVKIPYIFSRLGHNKQVYFISQWFPKPAVYDEKGWHPISYLDQGEFFSEYGSYDVSVTLPKNYVILATGNCLDPTENDWLNKKSEEPLPPDTMYKYFFPPSAIEMKTVRFHEDNVHDFAWFADKRWIVRKDTVVSPGNNQLVTTWAAFLPQYRKEWINATEYLKKTVLYYGEHVGPYPYKTIKAVLGDMKAGGGMEYPTITIIDKNATSALKTVVIHEAGHNWFYGLLGSMERDHAWMDEGLNTFYEQKTSSETKFKSNTKTEKKIKEQAASAKKLSRKTLDETTIYYEFAATNRDQPIDQTSVDFKNMNYGLDVYYKSSLMLKWLEKYVGRNDFEAGVKDYFTAWEYHHPYPENFKNSIQKHTNKNIDWFFDPILKNRKLIDFKISKVSIDNDKTEITLKNKAKVKSPVLVDVYEKGVLIDSIWSEPFIHKTKITVPETAWTKLKIDNSIPDCRVVNNVYKRQGPFHEFGLKLKPIIGRNTYDKYTIYISPALGHNQYDGFMAGLLINDIGYPENRFRFNLAPLYATGSNSFVGAGSMGYIWYPNNFLKEILLQVDGKTFHNNVVAIQNEKNTYLYFTKIAPSLNFTFKENDFLSTVVRSFLIKGYNIQEQNALHTPGLPGSNVLATQTKQYGLIAYKHNNNRTYNPFSYKIEGQIGADFAKINVESNIKINYNVKSKALYVRGYIGKFFAINNDPGITSRYELNTSYSGMNDYLYDGTFIGRNTQYGLGGQQISIHEGGFKVPVVNQAARSDNWLATINLSTDLPKIKLPLRLFFDAGLMPNPSPGLTNPSATSLLYDGGLEIHLIGNIVSIYLPLLSSNDFSNYLTNTYGNKNAFVHSISFKIDFDGINWLKLPYLNGVF